MGNLGNLGNIQNLMMGGGPGGSSMNLSNILGGAGGLNPGSLPNGNFGGHNPQLEGLLRSLNSMNGGQQNMNMANTLASFGKFGNGLGNLPK